MSLPVELGYEQPVFIAGERVYLTPFTRRHLEEPSYLRWMNDLETTKHLGLPDYLMPVSFQELESYFEQNSFSRNNAFFAVAEKSSDKFIGTLRVSHINWITRVAEIGIMLGDESVRGRGYASEMVQLAVDYAFDVLNMRKLVAGAHSENHASLRCFERLGFQQEGVFREQHFMDGRYYDIVRLGLFKRDYWQRGRTLAETESSVES
ncbi:MAG: GNAT family N-acetyltransferase [Chloroflexi bacterium]|nr:GNAT family N-acetyltransferase [Chloroflexota bacterium]